MDDVREHSGAIHVRLQGPLFERLENWRRAQPKIPRRSDALRELIERALTASEREAAA
jgi:hypothetical protein